MTRVIHIRQRKTLIQNYIDTKQDALAVEALMDLIHDEPTVSSYNFAAQKLRNIKLNGLGYSQIRIALLRSFTIEPLLTYLEVKCYQARMQPTICLGGYNSFQQEILDKESELYRFDPEIIVLAIRLQEICPELVDFFSSLSTDRIKSNITDVLNTVEMLVRRLRENCGAKVILHNFEVPASPAFGLVDSRQELGQMKVFQKLNEGLLEITLRYQDVYLLDYDRLTCLYGKLDWQDQKMWLLAKMPIAGKNLSHLADEYIRFIKPVKGLNRKCLVLDLDNTLWGGILGEDGFDGIQLGQSYPGNAYLAFQKAILSLYHRGIILAINSKNNEEDVIDVLENHPDMILRKKHFASMRVNWQDKAQNMREIADELNIGLDSLAFVDDSPVERELIKRELPEVLIVDMPDDPVLYHNILLSLPDFETLTLSDEDKRRGELYRTQVARKKLQQTSTSLEDFYRSLEMQATIGHADEYSIPRIAQLTQRTNQFNLTVKRYSEADILGLSESAFSDVFYMRLRDKFGDNGIVGVAIIDKKNGQIWEIDTFLLSCRVVGRTVETAFLAFIIDKARESRVEYVLGRYIPTKKNRLVRDLFHQHGFRLINDVNGQTEWHLKLSESKVDHPEWISISFTGEKQQHGGQAQADCSGNLPGA